MEVVGASARLLPGFARGEPAAARPWLAVPHVPHVTRPLLLSPAAPLLLCSTSSSRPLRPDAPLRPSLARRISSSPPAGWRVSRAARLHHAAPAGAAKAGPAGRGAGEAVRRVRPPVQLQGARAPSTVHASVHASCACTACSLCSPLCSPLSVHRHRSCSTGAARASAVVRSSLKTIGVRENSTVSTCTAVRL